MESSIGQIVLLFILLVFSGVFSGAETAIMSLEMSKIKSLKNTKKKSVERVEWLKMHPQKVIITLLIMNNVLNTLITVLATLLATRLTAGTSNAEIAMILVTIIISFLLILFGDVLPKSIAVAHSKAYTFFVAPSVFFLIRVFVPFIFVLEKIINFVTPHSHQKVTEEEVLAMISMGEEHGEITSEEKSRIENLLEFSETTVDEIMTPRTRLDAIDEKMTLKEARAFFLECNHTRIPVYKDTIDTIIDVMTLRDVLEESEEGGENRLVKNLDLKSPYFVPITKKISDLLKEFQHRKTHIAIVVDEFGGTAGIVTMEDIFEEIFGEIQDETDEEEEMVVKKEEGVFIVDPRLTLIELQDKTNILLEDIEDGDETTIALLVLEQLGRFARRGESLEFSGGTVVIEKIGNRSIEKVRVIAKKVEEEVKF